MKKASQRPDVGETSNRIKLHLKSAKDSLQRREICLTWDGYIAALLEWGLISIEEHRLAYELLMDDLEANDPAMAIFTGVSDDPSCE